jgi:hypothetical protein
MNSDQLRTQQHIDEKLAEAMRHGDWFMDADRLVVDSAVIDDLDWLEGRFEFTKPVTEAGLRRLGCSIAIPAGEWEEVAPIHPQPTALEAGRRNPGFFTRRFRRISC